MAEDRGSDDRVKKPYNWRDSPEESIPRSAIVWREVTPQSEASDIDENICALVNMLAKMIAADPGGVVNGYGYGLPLRRIPPELRYAIEDYQRDGKKIKIKFVSKIKCIELMSKLLNIQSRQIGKAASERTQFETREIEEAVDAARSHLVIIEEAKKSGN